MKKEANVLCVNSLFSKRSSKLSGSQAAQWPHKSDEFEVYDVQAVRYMYQRKVLWGQGWGTRMLIVKGINRKFEGEVHVLLLILDEAVQDHEYDIELQCRDVLLNVVAEGAGCVTHGDDGELRKIVSPIVIEGEARNTSVMLLQGKISATSIVDGNWRNKRMRWGEGPRMKAEKNTCLIEG